MRARQQGVERGGCWGEGPGGEREAGLRTSGSPRPSHPIPACTPLGCVRARESQSPRSHLPVWARPAPTGPPHASFSPVPPAGGQLYRAGVT